MFVIQQRQKQQHQQSRQRYSCSNCQKTIITACLFLLLLATMPTMASSQKGDKKTKPITVLHVGPHKTGTTSVQQTTQKYVNTLAKDDYIVLDFDKSILNLRLKRHSPAKNIAFCSCPYYADEHSKYCSISYYNETKKLLSKPSAPKFKGMNLLLSHESFDKECIDVQELRTIFSEWDVRVIVGYRRYFDWAVSLYGEDHRVELLPGWEDRVDRFKGGRGQEWPSDRNTPYESLKRWLTLHWMNYHHSEGKYTTAIVKRYAEIFGEDSVSILNMHDGMDVVENFLCHQVPGAVKTCKEFTNAKKHDDNAHVAASNAYDHITVEAYNAGLISGKDMTRPEARELIKHYQEVTLGLTPNDFPKDCLEEEELERLLELSIEAEKETVPDFFALEDKGEKDLREKFEIARTTKLCGVDTEKLFEDEGWKSFFTSLEKNEGDDDKETAETKQSNVEKKDDKTGTKASSIDDSINKNGNKDATEPKTTKNDDIETSTKNNDTKKHQPIAATTTSKTTTTKSIKHIHDNTTTTPAVSQEEERKVWLSLEFASSLSIIALVLFGTRAKIREKLQKKNDFDDIKLSKLTESQDLLPQRVDMY